MGFGQFSRGVCLSLYLLGCCFSLELFVFVVAFGFKVSVSTMAYVDLEGNVV